MSTDVNVTRCGLFNSTLTYNTHGQGRRSGLHRAAAQQGESGSRVRCVLVGWGRHATKSLTLPSPYPLPTAHTSLGEEMMRFVSDVFGHLETTHRTGT